MSDTTQVATSVDMVLRTTLPLCSAQLLHWLLQRLRCEFVSHEFLERGLWQRSTVQVALRLIAATLCQVLELVRGFHAFRNGRQTECVGETDQRRHKSARAAIRRQPAGESAIDLQAIDGQLGEPAQGGIAGTEIINRNSHSGRA